MTAEKNEVQIWENQREENLDVWWQDEVQLNIDVPLVYIKSGEEEIQNYVDNYALPEIRTCAAEQKQEIGTYVHDDLKSEMQNFVQEQLTPELDLYKQATEEAAGKAGRYVIQSENAAGEAEVFAQQAATAAQAADSSVDEMKKITALTLGSIVIMPFGVDESENKYRYLNGQVLMQDQYTAFTAKVKSWQATRASLFTTETNWQAEKTASKLGQCGKFVIDDTAGTIRLPLVKNINGLTDLSACGVIKSESLPNIKGNTTLRSNDRSATGAFYVDAAASSDYAGTGSGAEKLFGYAFDASRSSSAYQDNASVQQEAIQYPYAIVVNTGVEEAERPINNYQVNNVYAYGMSQYYKGIMNNNSWLKSAGQWNDGTVYTGIYAWIQERLAAGTDGFKASTETYTDYDFVLNTAEQTFRLPLKAELDVVPSGYNLYYYVGDTLQNSQLINVARIEEKLTNINASSRGYLVDSYSDDSGNWYRIYSDGWIEQGGIILPQTRNDEFPVTLLKPYTNTNYTLITNKSIDTNASGAIGGYSFWTHNKTETGFTTAIDPNVRCNWRACGYATVPETTNDTNTDDALKVFVVVANGQMNQSTMDWSAWASSLTSKVDKSQLQVVSVLPANPIDGVFYFIPE